MPQNDQVSVRDFQALERRVTELERRMDRTVAETNKSLQSAKGSDDSLIRRLEKIERTTNDNDKTSTRLDKIVEDLNKRLVTAKGYDDQLDQKIATLRKQIDSKG